MRYAVLSYNHLDGVLTVYCQDLFAVESRVQTCFITTMPVFNSVNVKNICGISLSYGAFLIHAVCGIVL